jgi:GR25 family glycosyltransferase involved in LPS biosynthesis
MKAYVINLDRSEDRRLFMSDQLDAAGIAYQRVPAIDGQKLTGLQLDEISDPIRRADWPKLLTKTAIACSLSHVEAYKNFLNDGGDWALILEDDVELPMDLASILHLCEGKLRIDDVFLIYFHGGKKSFSRQEPIRVSENLAFYRASSVWGAYSAGAYVISREVAERLARYAFPVHTTADSWGMFYRDGVIGGLWALLPPITASGQFASDIGYSWTSKVVRLIEKANVFGSGPVIRYLKSCMRPKPGYCIVPEPPDWSPAHVSSSSNQPLNDVGPP